MDTLPGNLVRLCITTEDKEVQDVVVNEDDTIWALKIKIFELLNIFPAKQSVSCKDPEEVYIYYLTKQSVFLFIWGFSYKGHFKHQHTHYSHAHYAHHHS
jgi:hypothetical protein